MTEFWIAFKVYLFMPLLLKSLLTAHLRGREHFGYNKLDDQNITKGIRYALWIWLIINITMWVMSK